MTDHEATQAAHEAVERYMTHATPEEIKAQMDAIVALFENMQRAAAEAYESLRKIAEHIQAFMDADEGDQKEQGR